MVFPSLVLLLPGSLSFQGASDKLLGGTMLLTAAVVFTYYTTWAMLLPFFEPSSEIHNFFPAREWAVRLPAITLVAGVAAIGAFVASTIINENRRNAQRARLRTA
ncbi:dolichol phosphate-mannose biosynthesis regulatory protein-domain-containing protein [Mycena belliarum]|uniref:Dolichol phosphate-mannose biosynthesis regulatory protein n=1 Tax=Mycena belliarum TaxID=1033014 RepID=A0AAD6UB74_9AGAR|nr:dolichol phosphate-mannose biosynthesis regulatory protein-domain-containing protein [Mycena belliae]